MYAALLRVAGEDAFELVAVDEVSADALIDDGRPRRYRVGCLAGHGGFAVRVTVFAVCVTLFDVTVTFLPD